MKDAMIDRNAWSWVTKPTLMLHRTTVLANIHAMAERMSALGLQLRPHFKTHQSREVGDWFRAAGVERITVSSIEMARYFADSGWKDITIAFPINIRAIAEVNLLAKRIRLGVLISDHTVIEHLDSKLEAAVNAWIEIDTGDGRSGFAWNDGLGIAGAAGKISDTHHLKFAGLLGHAGYTYRSHGKPEVTMAHRKDIEHLRIAAKELRSVFNEPFLVSTGDTPGCSVGIDFVGSDEVRPGNFVFYDIQQQQIGSCDFKQIGVALAAPVVAVYPSRSEVVLHAGGVHLAKDSIVDPEFGQIFGRIALPRETHWSSPIEGCYLRSISQEHGIAHLNEALMQQIQVGDLLAVLPVHSCMTADLMQRLYPIDSNAPQTPILMMKTDQLAAK